MICDVCHKEKKPSLVSVYRRECNDCRAARKTLKKAGVSHRAIREYLDAIGVDLAAYAGPSAETIDFTKARTRSKRGRPLFQDVRR